MIKKKYSKGDYFTVAYTKKYKCIGAVTNSHNQNNVDTHEVP